MSSWKKVVGSSLVTEIAVAVLVLVARKLSERIRQ